MALRTTMFVQNCNIALESLNSGCTTSVFLVILFVIVTDPRELRRTESRAVGNLLGNLFVCWYTRSRATTYSDVDLRMKLLSKSMTFNLTSHAVVVIQVTAARRIESRTVRRLVERFVT